MMYCEHAHKWDHKYVDWLIQSKFVAKGEWNRREETLPHFCAKNINAKAEMFQYLSARGFNLKFLNRDGANPLMTYCLHYEKFSPEVVDVLIEAGNLIGDQDKEQ